MKTRLLKPIVAYSLIAILTIILIFAGLRNYASSHIPVAHIVYLNVKGNYNVPSAFDISPDDKYIACVDHYHALKVWSIPSVHLAAACELPRHTETGSMTWLANGRDIAISNGPWMQNCVGAPSSSHITQQQIGSWPSARSPNTFKMSSSGKLVAEAWNDGVLQVWNEATHHTVVLSGPSSPMDLTRFELYGFAFSPDSSTVAAVYFPITNDPNQKIGIAGRSAQVRMYDPITGTLKRSYVWTIDQTFVEGTGAVSIAVSPDNKYVAAATNMPSGGVGNAVVLIAATGQKQCNLDTGGSAMQISFINGTPDIAIAVPVDGIRICNYKTGKHVHTFHDREITQRFAVSRDGRYLASSYVDPDDKSNVINLWDLKAAL